MHRKLLFIFLSLILFSSVPLMSQDTAWIQVQYEHDIWDISVDSTLTIEYWLKVSSKAIGVCLPFTPCRDIIEIDTASFSQDVSGDILLVNYGTDSILSTNDTLTFCIFAAVSFLPDSSVIPVDTNTLFSSCEISFKTDSLNLISDSSIQFYMDSTSIWPANFEVNGTTGEEFTLIYLNDTIEITYSYTCYDSDGDGYGDPGHPQVVWVCWTVWRLI